MNDLTERNIRAVLQHSNDTRALIRDLEAKFKVMENQTKQLTDALDMMRGQMQMLQVKVFTGGPINGD